MDESRHVYGPPSLPGQWGDGGATLRTTLREVGGLEARWTRKNEARKKGGRQMRQQMRQQMGRPADRQTRMTAMTTAVSFPRNLHSPHRDVCGTGQAGLLSVSYGPSTGLPTSCCWRRDMYVRVDSCGGRSFGHISRLGAPMILHQRGSSLQGNYILQTKKMEQIKSCHL